MLSFLQTFFLLFFFYFRLEIQYYTYELLAHVKDLRLVHLLSTIQYVTLTDRGRLKVATGAGKELC